MPRQNNDKSPIPIRQKFLDSGDLFGLRFRKGSVFFEVQDTVENKYKPYNVGSVSSDSESGFSTITDSNGNEILRIDNKSAKRVMHVAIGHNPIRARRYTNYPQGETRLRRLPNRDIQVPRPANGDPYGYIDGSDSPYEDPTDAEELWIPPGVTPDFSYYNPTKDEVDVELNIKMAEYNVELLDSSSDKQAIERILRRGSAPPYRTAGSPRNPIEFDADWDKNKLVDARRFREAVL